ncbi:hypothetical protein HUU59_03750 [bacterium]|nr:hypothetical protein [bacterium]
MVSRYLTVVTFSVPLLFAAGCELFETREPEPPAGARGSWEVPISPEDVLTNLSLSLFERNSSNYMRSFSPDSFVFMADPIVLQQHPSMSVWETANEQSHINSLFSEGVLPSDSILFVVFSAIEQTLLGDTAHITTHYELTAQVAIAGSPGRMAGEAQFSLEIGDQGYWEIRRWSDQRTEEAASWSDLKALVQSR